MSGLLTDLYELTMAAGFYEAGKSAERATFELSIRRLPKDRKFVIAAGLHKVVDFLLGLSFLEEEVEYLRGLPQFKLVSNGFFDALRKLRFTGDLFAVPEGTPVFAGEPVLTVRAPVIEAQLPETYLLAAVTFESLIATKAARVVDAAGGRPVVEFGTRRAHTAEAGVLGARAAYIGGCLGTSNTLAGFRYGIPVYGTAAHSWVMSFHGETEAFRQLQKLLGEHTIQLIDTYDTLQGARRAAGLGRPLWGVRIDSGEFVSLSRQVRSILDSAGLRDARIMASGDLNEYKIRDLVQAGAPIDSFGVGTELATSFDAPSMGTIYKLVEQDVGGIKRYTLKLSEDKTTLPGAKQIFRFPDRDVLARAEECSSGSEALLRPVILGGRLIEQLPDAHAARRRAAEALRNLPPEPYRVERSRQLEALVEQARRNLA
ncbi:MAG: nicotinate phosphoribosyltransferase [Bryobacterales bacterium]|nr:nicotinate phosphoribosyltransferase [Bryobacterales bacterium]